MASDVRLQVLQSISEIDEETGWSLTEASISLNGGENSGEWVRFRFRKERGNDVIYDGYANALSLLIGRWMHDDFPFVMSAAETKKLRNMCLKELKEYREHEEKIEKRREEISTSLLPSPWMLL